MPLGNDDESLLRRVYRRLEDRPLKPEDPFYQPIYEHSEGEDPVAKLQTHIEWTAAESLQLFSGFRGTGKTTELFRLRRDLERKGCLVLYADALDYLNAAEPVDITTMLLGIAGTFGEQLERSLGRGVLKASFWERFRDFLKNTAVKVSEASVKAEAGTPAKLLAGELKAGLDLKLALKTAPSFRQRVEQFMADRLGELKAQVNAFVEEGVKQARRKKKNADLPVIFLFDQFEQIRGSRSNEQAVIQSVQRLFAHHLPLLRLPLVHVIYTVPPWLQFALPGGFSIETLPCIRLWNNDEQRTRYERGHELLLQLIHKRFGPEAFARVFGPGKKGADLADELVTLSGGHFRDLLRLFRETLVLIRTWRPELPVTSEVLDRAVVNVRNEYLPIALEDARWLDQIARRRDTALPDASPESIGRLSRYLDTHLVLYLTNGRDWYDLHPLIREEVERLARTPAPEKAGHDTAA